MRTRALTPLYASTSFHASATPGTPANAAAHVNSLRLQREVAPRATTSEAEWTISERDYPEGDVVLGVEVRTHSVKAALVDVANGEFQRPGLVAKVNEPYGADELIDAMRRAVDSYSEYSGPIGCSVTRAVVRQFGNESQFLEEVRGRLRRPDTCSMIHSEAAAYGEMVYGAGSLSCNDRSDDGEVCRRVIVATLGRGLGAKVLVGGQISLKDDVTHLTWQFEMALAKLLRQHNLQSKAVVTPPAPDDDHDWNDVLDDEWPLGVAWSDYGNLVGKFLRKVGDAVRADMVVVTPTGCAATIPSDVLLSLLQRGIERSGDGDGDEVQSPTWKLLAAEKPQGCLVKGAARGAYVRLSARKACAKVHAALAAKFGRSDAPIDADAAVTSSVDEDAAKTAARTIDVDAAVAALDADGDGGVSAGDLVASSVDVLGVSLTDYSSQAVIRSICGEREQFNAKLLASWYEAELISQSVVPVMCFADLRESLERARKASVSGNGAQFIVLEVTSDSCRACRKFERKFERIASRESMRGRATFLRLQTGVGKGKAAAAVCDWLKVEATPTAIFFKGKEEVGRFVGSDVMRFDRELQSVLDGTADAAAIEQQQNADNEHTQNHEEQGAQEEEEVVVAK